jgi:polyhydroxybutyrate depolymerase
MLRLLLASLLACAGSGASALQGGCREPPGCQLANGRYLALAPSGWDGTSRLPVVVFFHGWRESAEYVLTDRLLMDFAERHQVLLVAPHGEGNTWSYPGAPGKHRDEFVFAAALVADVKARFPVDSSRFAAAGFSQGASMVWNIACRAPGLFSAYGALAGGFWEPSPEKCAGEGVNLIHIHGLNDPTVPMGGRSLRGGVYRQSDIRRDWRVWLEEDGCSADGAEPRQIAGMACQAWTACARPKQLAMCTHEGGHQIHAPDLEALWSFVETTAARR